MERQLYFDAKIRDKLESTRQVKLNPAIYADLVWQPCTVRILMVADSFLYFSDESFGLSDLIGILKNENLPYARFDISVAHRDNPTDIRMGVGNTDITSETRFFRFDNAEHFDPSSYDQVWLFGAQRSRANIDDEWSNRLSDRELRVLVEFMDSGGGIFATGDHEDLGAAMGGFLPRARQMRRWFYPATGPNGEGLAPPFEGPGRFDTNREGHDVGYQFNDQSDDIPQPIVPRLYSSRIGVSLSATYPHPVLCGPNGTIKVLPDHPHESQCTGAVDPDATETLDGKTFTEFPAATDGGARPLPEIIATSTVIGGHTTTRKTGTTVARSFGAISAYDGHRANVGRIVCDATWHHFINVNLTGESGAAGPKALGFIASASGQDVYDEIKSYFVNIALWISTKNKVRCIRNWGLFYVVWSDQLAEVFDPAITTSNARLIDYVVIGRHAKDAIGNFAGQCQGHKWTWEFVLEEFRAKIFIDMGDPWRREFEPDDAKLLEFEARDLIDLNWLGEAALGGAILALREKFGKLDQKMLDTFDDVSDKVAVGGAKGAIEQAMPFIEKGLSELQESARRKFSNDEK